MTDEAGGASAWMSATDHLMYGIEHDPRLRMSSSGFLMLEETPDVDRLRYDVERMTMLGPRFRQLIVPAPAALGPPRFVADPDFDLAHHFRHIGAPGDGSTRDLLDYIAREHTSPYDPSRPCWMFTLITGMSEGPKACLYMRIHHAITDGVGGLEMVGAFLSMEPNPQREPMPVPRQPDPRPSDGRLALGALLEHRRADAQFIGGALRLGGETLRAPARVARRAAAMTSSLARGYKPGKNISPLFRPRSRNVRIDELQVPLDELKAASKVIGGKLNDALLAGIARGLRRYHDAHGTEAAGVRLQMVVNKRTDGGQTAGNVWASVRIELPLDGGDALEALVASHAESMRARDEPLIDVMGVVAGIASRLPGPLLTAFYRSQVLACDGAVSNLPGIPVELYAAGARVDRYVAIGPIGGTAFNITAMSYENQINMSVQTDTAAVGDPEAFVDCLRDGFREVLDLPGTAAGD